MNTPINIDIAEILFKEHGVLLSNISDVVMWLYEKHGVWIMVKRVDYKTLVRWDIYVNNNYVQQNLMGYNSITEAYKAAITYVLNNLT